MTKVVSNKPWHFRTEPYSVRRPGAKYKLKRIYLPRKVLEWIESNCDLAAGMKLAIFLSVIYRKTISHDHVMRSDAISLPETFIKKIVPSRYYTTRTTFVNESGMISVKKLSNNTTYSTKHHKCKYYILHRDPFAIGSFVWFFVEVVDQEDKTNLNLEYLSLVDTGDELSIQVVEMLKKISIADPDINIRRAISNFNRDIRLEVMSRMTIDGKTIYYKNKKFMTIRKSEYAKMVLMRCILEKTRELHIRYHYWLHDLKHLGAQSLLAGRDRASFRLHHLLTRVPSRLLNKLKFAEEAMVEIDLANSQPRLLVHVLENIIDPHSPLKSTLDYLSTGYKESISNLLSNNTNTQPDRPNNLSLLYSHFDLQAFLESTWSGRLYTHFRGEPIHLNSKKSFFKLIFGDLRYMNGGGNHEIQKLRSYYPGLVAFVRKLKVLCAEKIQNGEITVDSNSDSDHIDKIASKFMSIALQRIESFIFIDIILPRIYVANIDALPKHIYFWSLRAN